MGPSGTRKRGVRKRGVGNGENTQKSTKSMNTSIKHDKNKAKHPPGRAAAGPGDVSLCFYHVLSMFSLILLISVYSHRSQPPFS